MEFNELLNSRRSVRQFTGKASDEEIENILQAAEKSPIAMGQFDKYHLTVISNPDLLKRIDLEAAEMFGRGNSHPLYGAQTLILVSASNKDPMTYSSAGIVIHNMVLEAENLGLGACYIFGAIATLNQHPQTVEKLGLPKGFTPLGAVAIGQSDEKIESRTWPESRIEINRL